MRLPRFRGGTGRLVSTLALVLACSVAAPAHAEVFVDDTPERAWTVNGRVYAVETVGDTVFVGGSFDTATAPDGTQAPRRNLAAFRLSDGGLVTDWRADVGSTVRALDSDGTWLWVGGFFGTVDGVGRSGVAKVGVVSGNIDTSFNARLAGGGVRGIDVDGADLYLGGHFTSASGQARSRVAKVDSATGGLDTGFVAAANDHVFAIVKNPTQSTVYVAGRFTDVNGSARAGVAGLSSVSGALSGPVQNGSTSPTYTLAVSDDGSRVYSGAGSNAVTSWRTADGSRAWRRWGEGDLQAMKYYSGTLYFGFHDGFEDDLTVKVLAADGLTGAEEGFRPRMTQFWGVFGIDVTDDGVVIGGDFTTVDGVTARGWARFLP